MRLGARARSPPLERPALRFRSRCWCSPSVEVGTAPRTLEGDRTQHQFLDAMGGSTIPRMTGSTNVNAMGGSAIPRMIGSTSIEVANVEQAARVEGTWREHRAASTLPLKGASETRRERRGGEGSAEQAAVSDRSDHPRKQPNNRRSNRPRCPTKRDRRSNKPSRQP